MIVGERGVPGIASGRTDGVSPRTYLFVPGNAPDKLDRAWTRGADALIVDLEDAIPHAAKTAARDTVAAWLGGQGGAPGPIWVRVNNVPEHLADDINALAGFEGLTGVVVPKIEGVGQVDEIKESIYAALDKVG